MLEKIRTLSIVSAVLFLLLFQGAAVAAPISWDVAGLGGIWDALRAVVTPSWSTVKTGQCIDPNGVPCDPEAESEHGALIDPNGAPAPTSDTGTGTGSVLPDGATEPGGDL